MSTPVPSTMATSVIVRRGRGLLDLDLVTRPTTVASTPTGTRPQVDVREVQVAKRVVAHEIADGRDAEPGECLGAARVDERASTETALRQPDRRDARARSAVSASAA